MPFKFDYRDGAVLEWSHGSDGPECERNESYTPTIYVSAGAPDDLAELRDVLSVYRGVRRTAIEEWRTGFRHEPGPVLRLDVADLDAVGDVAGDVRGWGAPGKYRCYDVDFTREFRYCLETRTRPVPDDDLDGGCDGDRTLSTLEVAVSEPELAGDGLTELTVGGERVAGDTPAVLETLAARVRDADPDVLVLSRAEIVPTFYELAARHDREDLDLGRLPGWQRLAGASTYESYGRIGHSPARYSVPGRVIVDRSNTFFFHRTNLAGCLDLARRSGKPLQELAWASIGNVLTGIQIREARERGVLVPWNSWRHERWKTMRTLHEADRGGFTFAPDVGFHEDVHELDFSSLYPNIIVTRNVSPETVRCDCHPDRADVPGLGYAICPERGYLPDVLRELVADRDDIKADLASATDPERRETLRGRSDALKWILVACFGYQGFSNAKFGRIECHEAINAFAREILLDAKETLEAGGWRVVHGIVDSLWVTPAADAPRTPLADLAARITEDAGIELEYEAAYDWIAFVPQRTSEAGALTKYFGRRAGTGGTEGEGGAGEGGETDRIDGTAETAESAGAADRDPYKYRGIECRQRSTCAFVERAQRDLIETLDRHRTPAAVCERLRGWCRRLESGDVDPAALAIRNRVSKRADEYEAYTRNVAALERAADRGVEKHPGQDVRYVVTADGRRSRDRVRLAFEDGDGYDASFYRDRLLRAAESVLSPLGWRRDDVEGFLAAREDASLLSY